MYNNSPIFKWNILMRCADAQNLASSHASLPDWRGSQGNKLMRETNQDFAAWIESEKMAEKKIKKVSASAASRWVLELDSNSNSKTPWCTLCLQMYLWSC